jgi:trehalose 6-phosphate synthase
LRSNPQDWGTAEYRDAIHALCQDSLADVNLILASNRGPVEFRRDAAGGLRTQRGQGGLVTALSSMVECVDTNWVAAPFTDTDAEVGESVVPAGERMLSLSFVKVESNDFHRFYNEVSNSLLWFLQHGISHAPDHPEFDADAWSSWEAYCRVNQRFAETIARKARQSKKRPVVMIHDYHLYLVPLYLRRLLPEALIHHFTHICWPGPDLWWQLPPTMRREIVGSLASCDLVGFHTPRYVRNFLATVEEVLGLPTDLAEGAITGTDRRVWVRDYPISIDPEGLQRFAESPAVRSMEAELGIEKEGINLVQVARTDPSKNILRSLKALDVFLSRWPRYRGQVRFWGILPASRQGSDLYRSYLDRLWESAQAINRRHGGRGPDPVTVFLENSYPRAIAAMKHYDILLVNSLADGMNLVAKEGPMVNQRDGVLLLSETTGAAEELMEGALSINPYDLVGMAEAIEQGLTMPRAARHRLNQALRQRITQNPIQRWTYDQLVDVQALIQPRLRVSPFYQPTGVHPTDPDVMTRG